MKDTLYFISTKEIKNPWVDKRTRYGISKHSSFPIGTKVYAWDIVRDIAGVETPWREYFLLDGKDVIPYSIYDKNGDRVKDWSIPEAFGLVDYTPSDIERIHVEISSGTYCLANVMEYLIETGRISFDEFKALHDEIYKED